MSKLDELINELCPDGVEYKKLEEITIITKGKQLNKSDMLELGPYPVLNGGANISGYNSDYNSELNTITISQGGNSAGFVNFMETKFWAGAHCYLIKPKTKNLNNKFLFYFLKQNQVKLMDSKKGAGIPGLNKKEIHSLVLPFVPLPIQEEIVRILDTFTELTAELTAELIARKKQYEYYRDKLLTFDDRLDVKKMSVGNLFEFKNGLNKGKEYFGKGSPIVNFTDVYKNKSLTRDKLIGKVDVNPKEMGLYSACKGDVFFTRTSETQEEIGMTSVLLDDVESCVFSGFVLRARPKTDLLLPKYCSYCFSTYAIRKQIIKYSTYTTRALTSGTKLSKIILPVPPLPEQERIVKILDKFDTLTNDISKGLPAEIEARQKQYEYYRDKLLTFKEKKA